MPFPPTAPSVTLVTNHTLTLDWTPPDITGNLPLTAYIVEVLVLGNSLCPQSEPEWEEQQRVDNPTAVQTIVMGLIPFQHYNVRIRAVNSNFESEPSPAVESVWTQPSGQPPSLSHMHTTKPLPPLSPLSLFLSPLSLSLSPSLSLSLSLPLLPTYSSLCFSVKCKNSLRKSSSCYLVGCKPFNSPRDYLHSLSSLSLLPSLSLSPPSLCFSASK